jgi:8-oxo-dGTP pyrophosphatase MutT (NUDIX family)
MTGPVDLSNLLANYVPNGDEASVAIARAALVTGRSMWARTEFDPGHFTASGFVLSPDRSSLLLIHHGRLHRWLQPGGHIEPQDGTVEAAARREVAEETGLTDVERVGTSLVSIDGHSIPGRADEPAHVHIDLGVGFIAASYDIAAVDEVLDARWIPLSDLARYTADTATRRAAATLTTILAQDEHTNPGLKCTVLNHSSPQNGNDGRLRGFCGPQPSEMDNDNPGL